MKRHVRHIIVCTAFALVVAGCSSSDKDWDTAQKENTAEAYHGFLEKHPDSPHAAEAQGKVDALLASDAVAHADRIDEGGAYAKTRDENFASPLAQQRDDRVAEEVWSRIDDNGTRDDYRMFVTTFPKNRHAEEALARSRDYGMEVTDVADARLDVRGLNDTQLTFVFVDVTSQWADRMVVSQEHTYGTTASGERVPVRAYLHYRKDHVHIDAKGALKRAVGSDFIHTRPLSDTPQFPTTIVSNRGHHIYRFAPNGTIRLGLFVEGNKDELATVTVFGQEVRVHDRSDVALSSAAP